MPFLLSVLTQMLGKFWDFIGELYEFNCLPNGYSAAPRIFTNLCSQFSQCWEVKDRCRCFYLDDSLVIGNSSMECKQNIERTWELLVDLGFVINTQKSSCSPSKEFFFPWLHLKFGKYVDFPAYWESKDDYKFRKGYFGTKLVKIRLLARLLGCLLHLYQQ